MLKELGQEHLAFVYLACLIKYLIIEKQNMKGYLSLFFLIILSGCMDNQDKAVEEAGKLAVGDLQNAFSNHNVHYFTCDSSVKDEPEFRYDGPTFLKINADEVITFDQYSRKSFKRGNTKNDSKDYLAVKSVTATSFHPFNEATSGLPDSVIDEYISHGIKVLSQDAPVERIEFDFRFQTFTCKQLDGDAGVDKVESIDRFFDDISNIAEKMEQNRRFSFRSSDWWTVTFFVSMSETKKCSSIADGILEAARNSYSMGRKKYYQSAGRINQLGCLDQQALSQISSSRTLYELDEHAASVVNLILDLEPYRPRLKRLFN